MGGNDDPDRSGLIVYIDRSDVSEDRKQDLKAGIRRLVDVIPSLEPQLISYAFHLDDEAAVMTVVAVHPDSASLELHLEIGRTEFHKLADMITLRQIEVYGSVSDKARAMLQEKATMLGGTDVTVMNASRGSIVRRPRGSNPAVAA